MGVCTDVLSFNEPRFLSGVNNKKDEHTNQWKSDGLHGFVSKSGLDIQLILVSRWCASMALRMCGPSSPISLTTCHWQQLLLVSKLHEQLLLVSKLHHVCSCSLDTSNHRCQTSRRHKHAYVTSRVWHIHHIIYNREIDTHFIIMIHCSGNF